jgi:hypothetical protein
VRPYLVNLGPGCSGSGWASCSLVWLACADGLASGSVGLASAPRVHHFAAAVGIKELPGAADACTAAERAAAVPVVAAEAAADQRGHGDLLRGWCRRLPAASHLAAADGAAARSAGGAAGPAVAYGPTAPGCNAFAGAFVRGSRATWGTITAGPIRRAGRPGWCANPVGAAVRYDQNSAAAAGSDD